MFYSCPHLSAMIRRLGSSGPDHPEVAKTHDNMAAAGRSMVVSGRDDGVSSRSVTHCARS